MRTALCLLLAACAALQPARGAMLSAEPDDPRQRTLALLARPEAREALAARGVSPAEAEARVMALSDEEALELSAAIDRLPAGGSAEAFAVIALTWYVLDTAGGLILLIVIVALVIAIAN